MDLDIYFTKFNISIGTQVFTDGKCDEIKLYNDAIPYCIIQECDGIWVANANEPMYDTQALATLISQAQTMHAVILFRFSPCKLKISDIKNILNNNKYILSVTCICETVKGINFIYIYNNNNSYIDNHREIISIGFDLHVTTQYFMGG